MFLNDGFIPFYILLQPRDVMRLRLQNSFSILLRSLWTIFCFNFFFNFPYTITRLGLRENFVFLSVLVSVFSHFKFPVLLICVILQHAHALDVEPQCSPCLNSQKFFKRGQHVASNNENKLVFRISEDGSEIELDQHPSFVSTDL